MQNLESVVAALPMFEGLKPEHVRLISGCASTMTYGAGEFMGREGDPADRFWVIRQGRVALELHAPGRGSVTIQTIGDDEIVGWSWLVPPYQLRFDVHAVVSTRALAFDGRCLREKIASDPEFGFELLQRFSRVMLRRMEAMSLQLLDLYGEHHGEHE
jgi:CRP/FNR family transcriptional regulator, cyclic AMP receptor protein